MSGATIGGVIGAVVFTVFGGSPQVGWMVGSAIGGYIDPTQIYGPRLSDMRGQTSAVGGAIPRAWGTAPVPGNVIWQQPGVTEHKHTDDGKGSGTEQVTYTYTRSYAVMFHIGEIAGVLQIKRNGKIVYDTRDDDTLAAEWVASGNPFVDRFKYLAWKHAENAKFIGRCTIYTGTQTQNPDPTIEAYDGVGNVPSYRGRAYFVVTDDETQAGEIAQYEIIVAACGTSFTSTPSGSLGDWSLLDNSGINSIRWSIDAADWTTIGATSTPLAFNRMFSAADRVYAWASGTNTSLRYTQDRGATYVTCANMAATWSSSGGTANIVDGRLLIATNEGVTYSDAPELGSFTYVACPADTITKAFPYIAGHSGLLVAGQYSRWRSLDNGATWQDKISGTGSSKTFVCGASDGTQIVLGGGDTPGAIMEWTTDGLTYTACTLPASASVTGAFVKGVVHDRVNSAWIAFIAKAAASTDTILISADGRTWSETTHPSITASASAYGPSVDSFNGTVCCFGIDNTVGGSTYSILKSTNGGGSWTKVYSASSPQWFAIAAPPDEAWQPSLGAIGIPDAPGWYANPDGTVEGPGGTMIVTPCSTTTVGEVLADVCELSGLTSGEYDVSQLTDTLDGYVIAREIDGVSVIESLRPIGMFDLEESDGKVRFIKRGGTAVGSINGDDLVERDGDAFEREMVQEVELLRRVTVGYIDSESAWAPNTQKWERRVGTIDARGESTVEVSAVFGADQAATIAKRKGLAAWGEPEKQKFSLLSLRHAKYTPTDIINYTDADGEIHQLRLMQIEDDSGIREIESSVNCAEAYNATATGVVTKPPTVTDANLRGPTVLMAMNLDSLRSKDNVPGMYFAASGVITGWRGCVVEMSTDGGTSFRNLVNIATPATMGYITSAIDNNDEPVQVFLYAGGQLSSATTAQVATGANAAAIVTSDIAEIIQFETATAGGSSTYGLTTVTRGVKDTVPASHSVSDGFVLLDANVVFVPIDSSFAGQTLVFRAVSIGTSSDAATNVSVVYEPPTYVIDGGKVT